MCCSCKAGCAKKDVHVFNKVYPEQIPVCKCSKACRYKDYQNVDIANDDDEYDGNDDNDSSVDAGDQTDDDSMDWPSAWP